MQGIQNNSNLSFIRTNNGRFYVGMTYDDAVKKNLAHRTMFTDFTDLDVDSNKILSPREILTKRKHEAKVEYGFAGIIGVLGLFDLIISIGTAKSKLMWAAIDAFLVAISLIKARNIEKENDNIEKFLSKFSIDA